jgi:hypothetical protein
VTFYSSLKRKVEQLKKRSPKKESRDFGSNRLLVNFIKEAIKTRRC